MIERIISRGLDALAKFALRAMHGTEEASNDGKVKVCIIHGLTLVIKNSYTYCKSFISPRSEVLLRMPLGDRLLGKDHRSSLSATHKESNQRTPHYSNLLHNFNHTCMLRDLLTSTQVFFEFIITQLA